MKKSWSSTWNRSTQPRKQRKYAYNAPSHVRRKMLAVRLDKELGKKLDRKSLVVRKGDEVKITRGLKKDIRGKVMSVDYDNLAIYVDGQTRESVGGNKVLIPFKPSSLVIINANLEDKYRMGKKKGIAKKAAEPIKKVEAAPVKKEEETEKAAPVKKETAPIKQEEEKRATPVEKNRPKTESSIVQTSDNGSNDSQTREARCATRQGESALRESVPAEQSSARKEEPKEKPKEENKK